MDAYMFKFPAIVSVAFEVIGGKYGTDSERRKALEKDGYDYKKVQACVNDIMTVINKYGG